VAYLCLNPDCIQTGSDGKHRLDYGGKLTVQEALDKNLLYKIDVAFVVLAKR
jgi:hypothetical protein